MSFNPALAKSLLMAASIGMVVPMMAQPPVRPSKQKPKSEQPDTPAEAEAQIVGMELARKGGGFLGLAIEQGNFVVRFYDAEKKPVGPDVVRATVRWNPVGKVGEERALLTPGNDGLSMTSTKVVNPPFVFKAFLVLVAADEQVVDTYALTMSPSVQVGPPLAPP